jgi:chemotaxis signal transduction protein
MSITSPIRSRRSSVRTSEKTKQIISFCLRQEWFALPIETIQKVIQMGKVYGDPQGIGISLTNYQGQEILVIDVARRIFGENQTTSAMLNATEPRFLLIVQGDSGDVIGLPVDSTPVMRRVAESSFTAIPESYIAQGNIHCISSTSIQLKDHPPLFLLDANQLILNKGIG